jgi:hypothetical protein
MLRSEHFSCRGRSAAKSERSEDFRFIELFEPPAAKNNEMGNISRAFAPPHYILFITLQKSTLLIPPHLRMSAAAGGANGQLVRCEWSAAK